MQNRLNIDQRRFFNTVMNCFEQIIGGYSLNEAFIAKEKKDRCVIFLVRLDGEYYKTHNLETLCVSYTINKLIAKNGQKYDALKAENLQKMHSLNIHLTAQQLCGVVNLMLYNVYGAIDQMAAASNWLNQSALICHFEKMCEKFYKDINPICGMSLINPVTQVSEEPVVWIGDNRILTTKDEESLRAEIANLKKQMSEVRRALGLWL